MRYKLCFLIGLLTLPHVARAVSHIPPPPEPLSSFVSQVLTRVDSIYQNYIPTLSASSDCQEYRPNALEIALSDVRTAIDTSITLIAQGDDLEERTICHKYDLGILEARMEEVRELMLQVSEGCELATLRTLGTVHRMLNDAYASVLNGGLDPGYVDFQLRQDRFHSDGNPEAEVCPFNSDYAPPSLALSGSTMYSFGCDVNALAYITEQDIPEALKAEAQSTVKFMTGANAIAVNLGSQIIQFEQAFQSVLSAVRGVPIPPPVQSAMPDHGLKNGCKVPIVREGNSSSSSAQEVFKVETWDREDLPQGLLLRTNQNNFSIYDSAVNIIKNYMRVKDKEGRDRPLPFFTGTGAIFPFLAGNRIVTTRYSDFSANFAREEAIIEASSKDAMDRVFEAMSPLRSAVLQFGYLASFKAPEEDLPLVQSYVRDLALFLRRSCIWGYCNKTLDSVLKRVLNEHCYPYGSGCYRKEGYIEKCYDNTETTC